MKTHKYKIVSLREIPPIVVVDTPVRTESLSPLVGIFRHFTSEAMTPVENAHKFLRSRASVSDGFQGRISRNREFSSHKGSPFEIFSTLVIFDLLSGTSINGKVMASLRDFVSTHHEDGLFYFFEEPRLRMKFPADVDCTSIGASILLNEGIASTAVIRSVADKVIDNVNEDGVIQVYFPPRGERENRLDPIVCANAMYFVHLVGRGDEIKATEDFVYKALEDEAYLEGTRYYPSPDMFLYFLSRAVMVSPELGERFDPLLEARIAQRIGCTTYPIDLAVRIILCSRYKISNEVDTRQLLEAQAGEGNWPADAFFRCARDTLFFGGESLTTAFAVAALEEKKISGESFKEDYDFPKAFLNNETVGELTSYLTTFMSEHELFPEMRPVYSKLIATYLKYCSPEGANTQALEIAARYLTIFYFLNDYNDYHPREGFNTLLDDMLGILTKSSIAYPPSPSILSAVQAFRDELEAYSKRNGVALAEFDHQLHDMMQSFCKKWIIKEPATSVSDYMEDRFVDIGVRPYQELWKILGTFPINLTLETMTCIQQIEELACEIIYLINDLGSEHQDKVKGKPNLIFVYQVENGKSSDFSKLEVKSIHRRKVEEFKSKIADIRRTVYIANPNLSKYLHFLETCVQGNFETMLNARARYFI